MPSGGGHIIRADGRALLTLRGVEPASPWKGVHKPTSCGQRSQGLIPAPKATRLPSSTGWPRSGNHPRLQPRLPPQTAFDRAATPCLTTGGNHAAGVTQGTVDRPGPRPPVQRTASLPPVAPSRPRRAVCSTGPGPDQPRSIPVCLAMSGIRPAPPHSPTPPAPRGHRPS